MAEEYVCTLTDASAKKAKDELNENPSDRMAAVQSFREWIEQQKHIKCITSIYHLFNMNTTSSCKLLAII